MQRIDAATELRRTAERVCGECGCDAGTAYKAMMSFFTVVKAEFAAASDGKGDMNEFAASVNFPGLGRLICSKGRYKRTFVYRTKRKR